MSIKPLHLIVAAAAVLAFVAMRKTNDTRQRVGSGVFVPYPATLPTFYPTF